MLTVPAFVCLNSSKTITNESQYVTLSSPGQEGHDYRTDINQDAACINDKTRIRRLKQIFGKKKSLLRIDWVNILNNNIPAAMNWRYIPLPHIT